MTMLFGFISAAVMGGGYAMAGVLGSSGDSFGMTIALMFAMAGQIASYEYIMRNM